MTVPLSLALFALLGAGAWLFAHRFDRDAGGYADRVTNTATYPKKAIHAAFGALLAFTLARVMPAGLAVSGVLFIGTAYESGQGYISWLDLAADVAGACVAWGYLALTAGIAR